MSYYKYHVFFCTNQRAEGESCCNAHGAQAMRDYMKARVKELGSNLPDKVRINTAGCLDRCSHGPVIVIYPEATWYTYVDEQDIDEIIERHLMRGEVVARLAID